jgi:mxaJ protein
MSSACSRRFLALAAVVAVVATVGAAMIAATRRALQVAPSAPEAFAQLTSAATAVTGPPPVHDPRDLWVCADPNNMPFSDAREEGFENHIAALVADDLGRRLRYFWEPQRRGFVRTTIKAGHCDLVIGVPAAYDLLETTRPYYESSYVFVTRRDHGPRLHSFDDRRLAGWSIGIQITGDDYDNPPAAQALAIRHLAQNVRGFPVYGDYSQAAPQRTVIDAVAAGRVDTAVVWGPLAGYFASRSRVPLVLSPVAPAVDRTGLPFVFQIAMGVRRGDPAFRARLDDLIERRQAELDAILRHFAVPLVDDRATGTADTGASS